ncbi:FkbM family methyltransferase [Candidatus Pelagibacter bacterium nBUS_44]|uniref:FkbM family methyltransferase n=1 Tax=Candidatus Pelagibacter bacterium nBUS_44 TaxID=3374195 RepID=UPI003EBB9299
MLIFDKIGLKFFFQKLRNNHDLNTIRQIFIKEEYNFKKKYNKQIREFYNNILKENKIPIIIDCGSNIGASSNYFNIKFPKSKIIAIEPDTESIKIFKYNVNESNILLYENALSSEVFSYDLDRDGQDWRSTKIKKNIHNNQSQKTITISSILEKYDNLIYKPFLIKIDIEGHEKELFKKNYHWIKEFKIIIIELHDWLFPKDEISNNFFLAISNMKKKILKDGENTIVINKDI